MYAIRSYYGRFVKENYLITRHLREYLTLMNSLLSGSQERIEVGS